MSRRRFWTVGLGKEVRALLPVWLGSLVGVSAGFASSNGPALTVSCASYGFGAIALGSQLFGQEFGWRTVGILLAQPVDRRRLLALKLGALALVLAVSSLLMIGAIRVNAPAFGGFFLGRWSILAVGLLGFGVAPALTLATRSALAGLVVTCALPGLFLLVGDAVVDAAGLVDGSAADASRRAVFWWATSSAAAAGLATTAYCWLRLQWLDGSSGLDLPARTTPVAAARASRQAAWWQLVKKELRLQQLAIAVAGLSAGAWAASAAIGSLGTFGQGVVFAVMLVTFGGVVSLLIGAAAGAGEAQIGAREWQLLMPMPAWRQWAIKVGIVLTLAVVLCAALPAAMSLWTMPDGGRSSLPSTASWLGGVVFISAIGLYVGTLSRSATWAFVAGVPVLAPGVYIVSTLAWFAASQISQRLQLSRTVTSMVMERRWAAAALTMFAALLIALGYVNYRRPDRAPRQIAAQAAALAAVAFVLLTSLNLLRWS